MFITRNQHGNVQEKFVQTRTKGFTKRVVEKVLIRIKLEVSNGYYVHQ